MYIVQYNWIEYNFKPDSGLRYGEAYGFGTDDHGDAVLLNPASTPYGFDNIH